MSGPWGRSHRSWRRERRWRWSGWTLHKPRILGRSSDIPPARSEICQAGSIGNCLKVQNYLAGDIGDALVDICVPGCIWHKASTSLDWGSNLKEKENDGKPMLCQHPLKSLQLMRLNRPVGRSGGRIESQIHHFLLLAPLSKIRLKGQMYKGMLDDEWLLCLESVVRSFSLTLRSLSNLTTFRQCPILSCFYYR